MALVPRVSLSPAPSLVTVALVPRVSLSPAPSLVTVALVPPGSPLLAGARTRTPPARRWRAQVSKLLKTKATSFDHANIYRVSVAAAPLAAWVKANIRYSLVLDKIEPLEADLAEVTRSLER